MSNCPRTIQDYLRAFSSELGQRILDTYPALYNFGDPPSPRLGSLLRRPYPAQVMAVMGVVQRWEEARSAAVIAECGTGKTLISLAAVHVHSDGRPFTAIAMAPPHLCLKWAKEAIQTIPRLRVFLIDGLRDRARGGVPNGVNEVRLRHGQMMREGLHTSLTELRVGKGCNTARARWHEICPGPALFIVGRDRAKLSYFWRHTYGVSRSGPYLGCVVNPDTGTPVYVGDRRILASDFQKARIAEVIGAPDQQEEYAALRPRRPIYSALWQADRSRIRRVAPLDFIGRYMSGWFDYAICDEAHQLANDTAQGNGLGTLASCAGRIVILTGTLLGGYADDVFNILYRLEPGKMASAGYEWGAAGLRAFSETYGVLEKVTTIEPADNTCSKARVSKRIKRKPGASPLMFGQHLMHLAAFVSLEDVSSELPPYTEEVISMPMDQALSVAYKTLEEDVKTAIREHHGNHSVLSVGLNALLLYPDRPWGIGELYGYEYDPESGQRERFTIARAPDLDQDCVRPKEQRLIDLVKAEVNAGRRCHVYAVYTQKRDVTHRLERILAQQGLRVAVLTADVPPEKREAWFSKRLQEHVQVTISHPKIIETGIDLISHNCLIFYQTGYSLHTLRQASRRSWRIGQRKPVRVLYLHYEDTVQAACLRLMGKKLLVSLAMEGKFTAEGLQAFDDGGDILTAMARELVTQGHVGEPADAVWRKLQEQHAESFPARTEQCSSALAPVATVVPVPVAEALTRPSLIFGVKPASAGLLERRAKPKLNSPEGQPPLF